MISVLTETLYTDAENSYTALVRCFGREYAISVDGARAVEPFRTNAPANDRLPAWKRKGDIAAIRSYVAARRADPLAHRSAP